MIETINIKNFGPIGNAEIQFADLTILVGPQACGKSILLQMFKLLKDKKHILQTLDKYSYIVNKNPDNILEAYFGEGISRIWTEESNISINGKEKKKSSLLGMSQTEETEEVFYIPAQRILSMNDGRLKNFMEFDNTTPYVLKYFSEILRLYIQKGLGSDKQIFPIPARWTASVKTSFNDSVFHNGKIIMDERNGQKRLRMSINDMNIPFMTWSAGQKEFMPMLLGFYGLTGPKSQFINNSHYKYVIIEEPEMGLHPRAILSVMLQIIELMHKGYKVLLSTHSTLPLEFAWAFNMLKPENSKFGISPLLKLFGMEGCKSSDKGIFSNIWDKEIKTYLFSYKGEKVETSDISSLDASSENSDISEWGGLSSFASKASEIISENLW